MKLYVGNIPFSATEEDLRKFFHPTPLLEVVLCRDKETDRPRGFCFVRVDDALAEQVIRDRSGQVLGGRTVLVNEALEKRGGGGGGGSFARPSTGGGHAGDRDPGRGKGKGKGSRRRRDDSDYDSY